MDYLPASVQHWLDGPIDPHAQRRLESASQLVLGALTAIAFLVSYAASSVLLGLEVFAVGVLAFALVIVPPWPLLSVQPITFLPVRKTPLKLE
ncbi:hypothetical protein Q5752_001622 [Cryptotrichosporon argae]